MSANHRGVTVFVKRIGGTFIANTLRTSAADSHSATVAARRCAARHFEVCEELIDLLPDEQSQHLMIASVREREAAKLTQWTLRTALAIAGATALAGIAVALLSQGGVR